MLVLIILIALGFPSYLLTLLSIARCLRWALKRLFAVFSEGLRLLSLNSALGVKVGFRAAVFYGFPYKLRPKPRIATGQPLKETAVS